MRRQARRLSTFLVLALGVGSLSAGEGPGRVVDHFFAAYRAGDVEAMLKAYAPDATFEDVNQRHTFTGTDELRGMLGGLVQLHERMDLRETRRTVDGDTVVVEYVYTGRLSGAALSQLSGKECPSLDYTLPVTSWFTIRRGRIVAQKDYIDFATYQDLQRQLQSGGESSGP